MKTVNICDIKIPDYFKSVNMYSNTFKDLMVSIKALGQVMPITINQDHMLLDGQARLLACLKLGYTEIVADIVDCTNIEEFYNHKSLDPGLYNGL